MLKHGLQSQPVEVVLLPFEVVLLPVDVPPPVEEPVAVFPLEPVLVEVVARPTQAWVVGEHVEVAGLQHPDCG